jgi:hypothetical protein
LGIGDWGLGPIPNPQSPIPNPQSPNPHKKFELNNFSDFYYIKYFLAKINITNKKLLLEKYKTIYFFVIFHIFMKLSDEPVIK